MQSKPMIFIPNIVDQQPHRAAIVGHHDIGIAIVVHITKCGAAADLRQFEDLPRLRRNLFESTIAKIAKQLVCLMQGINIACSYQGRNGPHTSVGDKQIEPAIIVVVKPAGPETGKPFTWGSQTRR